MQSPFTYPISRMAAADLLLKIKLCVACNFASQHDEVAFCEGFAGDPTQWILLEAGIKNVIADGIANFVGMTFGDGFGGKNVTVRHGFGSVKS